MSAETGLKPGSSGTGTRERRIGRPGARLAALVAVIAAASAAWYGFLAHIQGHPAVRLAGALALASGGLAAVLLATPPQQAVMPVPGRPGPLSQAAQAAGTRTVAAILGLLSMATALIHFAVIEQHWATYWLYGAFFILVGSAQLAWALAITAAPMRRLLWGGVAGNALVVLTWIVTRTVGAPAGPDATVPERAGFGDLVATIMQVLIVAGAYVCSELRSLPPGVALTGPLPRHASLHEVHPELDNPLLCRGRRGRPRCRGAKIGTPGQLAAALPGSQVTVTRYRKRPR